MNFIKTTKGKVILVITVLLVVVGCIVGVNEFTKYQEAIKSTIVFKDTKKVGLSTDLMDLVESYDADTIAVNRIVDDNDQVVDTITVGNYKIVFEAVSKGHATEFIKEVQFIDDQAPVISGISDKKIEFGEEVNLLDGVEAIDNVDGKVEVILNDINAKVVGTQIIEFIAKDTAGNETKETASLIVKEPVCANNAAWNGENCVCSSGYTGDGWSACKVMTKNSNGKTTATSTNNSNTSSENPNGSSNSANQSNGSGGLSWELDVPSQEALDKVYQEGNDKYGEGNSWGANIDSNGNVTDWWQ